MGPGSHWEGRQGREHLQSSTRPSASGVDLLQLDVMFQLLKDAICCCCPKLFLWWHIQAASSSLRMHDHTLQAPGLQCQLVHKT